MPTLNYKYSIFPTLPQRRWFARQMRENRIQWNRAVKTRRRLLRSLQCRQIEHVLRTVFSLGRRESNANRAAAVARMSQWFPTAPLESWPILYDLTRAFGTAFDVQAKHTDLAVLAADLEEPFAQQMDARRDHLHRWGYPSDQPKAVNKDKIPKKPKGPKEPERPKVPLYWAFRRAIVGYAGLEAKRHIDAAFSRPRSASGALASIRFGVTGSGIKSNFEARACNPSKKQRENGATGDPHKKRRVEAFSYQAKDGERLTGEDYVIIGALPLGMQRVPALFHRPVPDDARILRVTVMQDGTGWRVVLTLDVSEEVYALTPTKQHMAIGVDPGSSTTLTAATVDGETGEVGSFKLDWRPFTDSIGKMEEISRRLSGMCGPDRRKRQRPSRRWLKLNAQRRNLHARIRRQRGDLLHRLSRELANHGFIALGDWTPPKKKVGRKELTKGEAYTVPQGPKGIVERRRTARDMSVATLRRLVDEKADRAGVIAYTWASERNSTRTCSVCGAMTGPKGTSELGVRQWTCSACGAEHDRDENAAMNILKAALADYRQRMDAERQEAA